MSVFSQDISIGASFDGTPASLGASPGRGGGFGGGGSLGSPIRSPGSNNIVPFKGTPVRGGSLGSPIKASAPSGTTLPGGAGNPASGQGRALPRIPSNLPFPSLPTGGLPGNPFAPSPKPFEPSGADKLPPFVYPNRLPPEAIGSGPVTTPGIPPPFTGGQMPVQYKIQWVNSVFGPKVYEWLVGPITYTREGTGSVQCPPGAGTYNAYGLLSASIPISLGTGCGVTISGLTVTPRFGQPDTGGDQPGGIPEQRAPNPARPKEPQPLPSAVPTGQPSRSPRPWPQREPSPAPDQQPSPYVSPDPAPLRPGTSPLPEELRPPAPAPAPAPVTDPAGNPISLPSGTPQGGSTAIGAPSSTGNGLGQWVKIQPISIPVPVFSPVNPAPSTAPATVPVQITFGQPQPVVTPITNYSTTTGPTPAIEFLPQPTPTKPPTQTGQCEPDPEAKCKYDKLDIAGKCETIIDKLEEDYSLAWDLPECEQDFTAIRSGNNSGKGLDGIAKQIESLYSAIKVLHDNTRCNDERPAIAAIPEWWQVRVGANRPQLVVLYAELKKDGSLGQSRWAITIPWFDASLRAQLKRRLPTYKKGQWQGLLVLTDNSKILVYARTKTEAEATVTSLSRLVSAGKRPSPVAITTGERKGAALSQVEVVPTVAHYYPTGQQDTAPAWTEKLRK